MIIQPIKKLHGVLRLPGDKSISHRAALFSALATGATQIENFASSADCAATLRCLANLGVPVERHGSTIKIKGVGKTGLREPNAPLDCENSGTTVRLLSGILAGQNFTSELTGDESLKKRPMRRVIEPLTQMGALVESTDGCLPLKIRGKRPLRAIEYELPVASAQVKSCVLLAGLFADGKTKVIRKKNRATLRDHTERMFRWLGVEVEETVVVTDANDLIETTAVDGAAEIAARNIQIPGDISSAAFFAVAAACLSGSDLTIENVGLNATRDNLLDILKNFDLGVSIENKREICNEPVGDLRIRGVQSRAQALPKFLLAPEAVAGTIDEIPILAILGTQLFDSLEVRGAQELRVKESDRIAAVVKNLQRMNARVEEFPDGFRVEKSALKGAKIDSFGDHRIAMAFAIAGLFADGATEINDADCVKVSFPEFFDALKSVCERN